MRAIFADNLQKKFGEKTVLDGVSLDISEGEIFGLLGPSGAGKTTLINIITGQLSQNGGYAEILGTDTRKASDEVRRKIGVMTDSFGLYERLSVYDNLLFFSEIYRTPKSDIDDILIRMGLSDARKTPAAKLSNGMKNRLSLARAMLTNAKLLFLDEPTSGLDPVTTMEIHEILKDVRKSGRTIFLTTHNMHEAQSLCDEIALLSQGKIIERGSPEEICSKYNYLNRLEITLKSGEKITLDNSPEAAQTVGDHLKKGQIRSIHSTEPSLETVFIELTGKGLSV